MQEIREYNRRIGGQEFRFTDYVLRGVNTKSLDADDALAARVRVVPNQAGANDSLLLRVYDEFEFAEDFLAWSRTPPACSRSRTTRPAPRRPTRASTICGSHTRRRSWWWPRPRPTAKAPPARSRPAKIEYWDYWRDAEIGGGKTAKEFVFVEMNSDTGWFQIWRGREFFLR